MGEIAVIVILGLIVFGPDRLPKAVKSLAETVRALRVSASSASRSLQEAAGWDSQETRQTIDELAQLHPKRIMGSILQEPPEPGGRTRNSGAAPTNGSRPGNLADFDPDAP